MKVLVISFSGGRTSALMTLLLIRKWKGKRRIIVIFCNTGQEHKETLDFVNRCDVRFNLNVVWLEAVIHHEKNKGITHKIVSYETACRDKSLFEEMIKKYGIPNIKFPHCTRELKERPFYSYLRSLGIKKSDREVAIGIRSDEIDRVNPRFKELGLIYPLIDLDIVKDQVVKFWKNRGTFNLQIPEHRGNCVWCWKKSLNKHLTLLLESPEYYEVPDYFEKNYASYGAGDAERVFFRGNTSTQDLIAMVNEGGFEKFQDINFPNGCEESCEVFSYEGEVE